jgi:carboxypeptidase C (cathepsin A)
VLSVNGYHDLATPYFQTALDLSRIGFASVQVRNYDGGHMTYLDDVSRPLEKADIRAFYRSVATP